MTTKIPTHCKTCGAELEQTKWNSAGEILRCMNPHCNDMCAPVAFAPYPPVVLPGVPVEPQPQTEVEKKP